MKKRIVKKFTEWWESLETEIIVRKKEVVLELLVCFLGGLVIGIMTSPRKNVSIGCHNGSDNVDSINTREGKNRDEDED